ncbi:MAG: hypothetical protein EOM26_01140 [Alphaproteobacteria bacterium]|nr:hypothetical protein [Alphaproteobacteria bacterium]
MSEKRKWDASRIVRFLIWTVLATGAFGFISLWILSSIGGNSDPLREGLEQFFSQATGGYAKIEELNNMSIYPVAEIDFSGLTIGGGGGSAPVLTLGRGVVSMRFWDVLLSRDYLVNFALENLRIAPGELGPGELFVEKAGIRNDDGETPFLFVDGSYNARPLYARFPLVEKPNRALGHLYAMDRSGGKFEVHIGDLFAQGSQAPMGFFVGGYRLSDLRAGLGEETLLSGSLDITRKRHTTVIAGELKAAESVFIPDIRLGSKGRSGLIAGELRVPVLALEDLGGEKGLGAFLAAIRETFLEAPNTSDASTISSGFKGSEIDLAFRLDNINAGTERLGAVTLPVRLADNVLRIEPDGTISGGDLSGNLVVNAATIPAKLVADFSLTGFDFGAVHKNLAGTESIAGRADIRLKLEGRGETWPELGGDLGGAAVVVAGKGKLSSNILEFWGGGVLNAMMPSLAPEDRLAMNCAIADFKVEKGVANAQTLFLDTDSVTVQGEGTIDFAANALDLKLRPESKDIALGDIAVPVTITGPIGNPSIGPSMMGLGAKLGGLLLGTVNPAFLAFSLTDLGLTEEHPCYDYIGKGEAGPSQ